MNLFNTEKDDIPNTFIRKASSILGDTDNGLTGSEINKYIDSYASDFDVRLNDENSFSNKAEKLYNKLINFNSKQRYKIIKELCEFDKFKDNKKVKELLNELISKYGMALSSDHESIDNKLVDTALLWLENFEKTKNKYKDALYKLDHNNFKRNLLDDLRLSFEFLLQDIFKNEKSFENQKDNIGLLLKNKNVSPHLRNMFETLTKYFTLYQNDHVKHDDDICHIEINFVFEITTTMMKFLIRAYKN